MKCLVSIVALVSVLSAEAAMAGVIAGPIVNPANGHTYWLLAGSTWDEAESSAIIFFDGHLTTINDSAEHDWIWDTFSPLAPSKHLWIGLNDIATEGTYVWVNGEPFEYANWALGEPDGLGEDRVLMSPNAPQVIGRWADVGNVNFPNGVVELPPPDPICGDNMVNQAGEECDGTDDAACPGQCQADCTCGPFCGDGLCDPSETCGSCPGDCGACPFCGDGMVNQPTEECDGSDDAACPGACQADCTCDTGCGDCPTDVDGSSDTGASDLAVLLGSWGPCAPGDACQCLDSDGNGIIGAADLAFLLGNWGPCS